MKTGYDKLRFMMLPIREIDKALPEGKIVDLGCGEGIISSYVAKNIQREVLGLDSDESRLQESNRKNLNFKRADITSFKFGTIDGAVISDVLHHIEKDKQKNLIKNIYKSLKKGGVFIIKEIDTGEFIRSRLSRFWDFVFYPKDQIFYWDSEELKLYLERLGFSVEITRPVRLFPGSTTLFICTKR